ncbi:MAG: 3'-5' exonuclease [Candidatus Paceibacterota bacterium]
MLKVCYLDTETGSLNVYKCALLQLGYIIEIDGDEIAKECVNIAPIEGDEIKDDALKVNGFKRAELEKFTNPAKAYHNFLALLDSRVDKFAKTDKMFLIGYNVMSFDQLVMDSFFKKHKNKYFGSYFWRPPIDVMALAAIDLALVRYTMEKFSLDEVAKVYKVKLEGEHGFHNALYDVEITRAIFKKLVAKYSIAPFMQTEEDEPLSED